MTVSDHVGKWLVADGQQINVCDNMICGESFVRFNDVEAAFVPPFQHVYKSTMIIIATGVISTYIKNFFYSYTAE